MVGGIGVQLDFEPGGKADLEELILPIWDVVLAFIRGRVFARYITESYVAELKQEAVDDGSFRAGEKDITFMFRDHAGCCTLSMYATHHWTRLALANAYDEVEALATAHGQRLHSPRLDVAAEIANGPSGGVLVSVKHRLWLATESSTGVLAVGDDQTASLTAGEARHVQAAARLRWCECYPCVLLRRDRSYPLRERQGWTSALIARWVCRQLGVDHEDLTAKRRGKQLARARAAAAFLITEEGPDEVSHRSLLGQATTSSLLTRGMEVVGDLGLVLPDDPAAP